MRVAAGSTGASAGGGAQPNDNASAGGSTSPPEKGVAAGRPAETLTALAGAVGAATAQLLDVENAAVVSVLIGLVGLVPALVTWLVEVGKKWDGPASDVSGDGVAPELEYAQARLLRAARMIATPGSMDAELTRVKAVRDAFADAKPPGDAK